ncbi:MAG TPA: FAD-binding oxidoreductase [Gaiellaceae bacterium]|nr:FAD-binding oxidoreductase [Gaiellaceae bacterium]
MSVTDLDLGAELGATFSGRLIDRRSAEYDEARRVHNGLVDRRPLLVAQCFGASDVIDVLGLARRAGLEVAIRGGGHSVAGLSTVDDGVVVDLSPMKGVHVDPSRATVRAQPGVTWRQLNRETALHGLAVTGGTISTTGIAGLTLGGGFGWLMGAFGLAADNLRSAEVVTAGGELLVASPDEHPDLFWALRGGGGNFGVVTSFEYALHPVDQVVGGLVAHPFEAARDVLRFCRELAAGAPDELGLVAALVHAPDGSGAPLAAIAVCHCGDRDAAERDLEPLLAFGSPALTQVGPMPYPAVNTMLDDSYPPRALNYWKSSFLSDLRDDAIELLVEGFAAAPSPMTLVAIEHHHGAATRVGVSETAVPHRKAGFNVLLTSVWSDPATTDANVEWTRGLFAALTPHLAGRRYVNYLDADDDGESVARAAYGENYERLAEVKRRYDPENVFRRNLNVPPAGS